VHKEVRLFAGAGVKRIAVLDPIFHAKLARSIEILEGMRHHGLGAHLSLQCRFELLTPEFLDALEGLNVTLEFGLQTIQEREAHAVNRPNNMDKASNAIEALHARGIDFEVSLIYGLPHQTVESFKQSANWCLDHAVPTVRAFPLMLLRGTQLAKQRDAFGFVESYEDERIPIVVSSHSFGRQEHAQMAALARQLPKRGRA
jgi:coproporphyrinogen III oxidase-like Fe-S oxidoreductase